MVGQTIPLSTSAWLCCKVGVGFPKLPAASWTQPQQGPSVPSVEGPVPKTYPWHVEHLHICKPTPTQSWEKMQLFNFHQWFIWFIMIRFIGWSSKMSKSQARQTFGVVVRNDLGTGPDERQQLDGLRNWVLCQFLGTLISCKCYYHSNYHYNIIIIGTYISW